MHTHLYIVTLRICTRVRTPACILAVGTGYVPTIVLEPTVADYTSKILISINAVVLDDT